MLVFTLANINLAVICVFFISNDYHNIVEKIYFCFSFGFLIFRTVAVSLYAAQINDASKEPSVILQSVPSSIYNTEVSNS